VQKLWLLFILIFSTNTFSGISEYYFKKIGISCAENGIQLNPEIVGDHQSLISCYSDLAISTSEIENLARETESLRLNLETWLYIQNSSKKILNNTQYRLAQYQKIQKDLANNIKNQDADKWKEGYALLSALYKEREKLKLQQNTCSNWRFWNYVERLMNKTSCDYVKSESFGITQKTTDSAIEKLELVYPIFHHPIFQDALLDVKKPQAFSGVFTQFLKSSIPDLETKIKKFSKIRGQELSKQNISEVLNSPQTLNEIVALGYNPKAKVLKTNSGYKSISLATAQCHINQKLITHDMDQVLKEFGKDVALVVSPFAIKGKLTAIFKGAKAAENLVRLNQAKGIIIAAEATYIGIDAKSLNDSKNQCDELSIEISQHDQTPKHLKAKAIECRELTESLATSYALAVIGGTAAIKLSKLDLTDIRISRLAARGKSNLLKSAGVIQSTIIKQSDIIVQQLDDLITPPSLYPEMATAGMTQAPEASSYKNSFHYNKTQDSSSTGSNATGSKNNKKKKKKGNLDNETKILEINARVDRAFQKLDCFVDKSCKNEIIYLLPGLKNLANGPKGLHLTEQVIDKLSGSGFKNISQEHFDMIKSCLKVKNKQLACSSRQFEAVMTLVDYKFKKEPHPHFYQQIIRSLGFDASEEKLSRSLYFVADHTKEKQGSISGTLSTLENHGGTYYLNGKVLTQADAVKAISLLREGDAIKLLSKAGFNISVIPETKELREAQGIQNKFSSLAKSENIAKGKNPDIIIDGRYIADIYSPIKAISLESSKFVTEGILYKTEGRNFRRKLTHTTHTTQDGRELTNYGKRQTNRVVVYADEIEGSPEEIASQIRKELGEQMPIHLQEAFIIFNNNGSPKTIGVWP
jgi:hypothetical protein